MLTNFVRAKVSTHSMAIALGVLAFATNHFFSDPQAADWLRHHWVIKDLIETAGATLVAFGIYSQPTKSA